MRLFVGQIPREWTEYELQSLFCQYGELQEVTILRHSDTFISKGCAFVTFSNDESAYRAIEELHDKFSPSEGRKIQVRDSCAPRANTETARLYCANLAETTSGNQVFDLFSQVGRVLSVSVLMTPWNRSKCSCLVEMASKADALAVIEQFHGRFKLPNAVTEMNVTWARNTGSKNRSPVQTQAYLPPYSPPQQYPNPYFVPGQAAANATSVSGYYAQQAPSFYPSQPMVYYDEQQEEEKTDEGPPMAMVQQSAPVVEVPYPLMHTQSFVFIAVPYPQLPPASPLMSPSKSFSRRRSSSSIILSPNSRYREGPAGANLFAKNFPLEWEDKDLIQIFEKFGEILSANVFIDRATGKSRGFGFVSFSNRDQATAAINGLNGLAVGDDQQLIVEVKLKENHGFRYSSALNVLEVDDSDEEDEEETRRA